MGKSFTITGGLSCMTIYQVSEGRTSGRAHPGKVHGGRDSIG